MAKATARLIRQWPGLGVLMAVAEFECGIIKERVIAGLAAAQAPVNQGMMIKVREKGKIGYVPLCDVEVTPKTNKQ